MGNPALDEFRERFTQQLVDHIDEHSGGRVDPDALRVALDAATDGWRVTADRDLIRGADGHVQNGTNLVTDITEPAVHLRRLTVTARLTREETPEEADEIRQRIERRHAAWAWEAGDHTQPPPTGVDILAMLKQRVWWRPKDSEPARLVDLAPSHRAHLLAFLRRNAAHYKDASEWGLINSIDGSHHGDVAGDALDSMVDELMGTSPQDWIEQRPLVKRLRKLVKNDEKATVGPTASLAENDLVDPTTDVLLVDATEQGADQ